MVPNSRKKKRLVIAFSIFVIISGILFLPLVNFLSDKFSESHKVDANILLVEGWVPNSAIINAYNEFISSRYDYIVTTGIKSPDYFMIYTNGSLVFYPPDNIFTEAGNGTHLISFSCYGELSGENSSKFNVYINDSLTKSFSAGRRKKDYNVLWDGSLSDIDSIAVQFINDGAGDFGDRNLYVKGIKIDKDTFIPYKNNSVYETGGRNGKYRITNNVRSYAQLARTKFIALGMDSTRIFEAPGDQVRLNRTLNSALAFKKWLVNSEIEIKGINIVTLGSQSIKLG